jgi:hypothetical protein
METRNHIKNGATPKSQTSRKSKPTKMKNSILLIFCLISISALAQLPPNIPTNGLAGYWPFNGDANDESGNNNNGTVNGAMLTSDRFNINNRAYDFNGTNNFITIPNSNSIDITGAITVNAWVKLNDTTTYNNIISKDNDIFSDRSWFFGVNYNRIIVSTFNPGQNDFEIYSNNFNFHTNWSMVTFSYDLDSIRLYVNSNLQLTSPYNSNLVSISEPLKIGVMDEVNGANWFFKGKIDDIGLWSRALTQQEISSIYNSNLCFQYITVTDTLLINTNITSYNPLTYQNTIKIYPNPTNDHITIDYGNYSSLTGYQVKILNSQGQQVFQTNINQQTSYINLGTWTGGGLYFVHVIDGQGNTTDIRKIVLQ